MPPLVNDRHEGVARLLAAGCSAEDASAQAGFDIRASSFASNARKRAGRPDIRARVKELQGEIADKLVEVTAELIEKHLVSVAFADVSADAVKPSDKIAALRELAKIRGMYAPEKHDVTLTNLAERLDRAMRRTENS